MIVLISGKQGSGKTTLTKALIKRFKEEGYEPHAVKFADTLYKMHDAVLHVLQEAGIKRDVSKDGPLLQLLGTEWGRKTLGDDVWCKIAANKVTELLASNKESFSASYNKKKVVILDDARFENEFDVFPDALKIRLECDRDKRKGRCDSWRENEFHPSETGLDAYAADNKFDVVASTDHGDPNSLAKTLVITALSRA